MAYASKISNDSCQSVQLSAKLQFDTFFDINEKDNMEKTCLIEHKNWDDYFNNAERMSDDFMVERCQMPHNERESFD